MHQAMNAVLRVHFHQEMHVIRHDVQLEQLGTGFSTDIQDNSLEPGVNSNSRKVLNPSNYANYSVDFS